VADEGISYEIRIDAKLSAIDKALNRIDSLIDKLEKGGRAAEHGARKTETSFKGVGKAIDEAKEKAHGFFEFVGAVAAVEVLDRLADKFAEVGKEAIKSAAHAERMNRVIDAVSGGHEAGEGNRKWLSEFSKKTEFSEDTSEGAFVDLKRVGSSDQAAKLAIKAAGDIAAVSRDKDAAFSSAIEAFSRLERTGKVSNRTLAPLGLGEKDFAALPEFAKLSQKQLEKKVEEGSVDRNQLMRLIMAHTGEKAIGSRAADNIDLLQTKLEKLTQLPERFYKRLGETSAVKTLSSALDGILEKLDPDSPNGQKIFGALEHAFTAVADAVGKIDFDELGDTLRTDVIPLVEHMAGMIEPVVDAFERAFRAARRLYDLVFGDRTQALGEVLESWGVNTHQGVSEGERKELESERSEFAKRVAERRQQMQAAGEPTATGRYSGMPVKAWHGEMHMVGEGVGDGLAKGISDGADHAVKAAGDMAHDTTRATRKALDAHSPSVVFEDLGATVPDGFSLGIKRGGARVGDAVDDMLSIPSPRAGGTTGSVGGVSVSFAPGAISIAVEGGAAGSPAEIASAVREELMRSLRPELLSLFEQVNLEGGS
jgi:hypothetical protein